MIKKHWEYLDHIHELFKKIRDTQEDTIEQSVELIFAAFKNGGSIFAFGASHAGIVTEELYCRAGGMMITNPVFNPTLMLNTRPFPITSGMERLEGFGQIIIRNTPLKKDDVLIIHSVSGRNAVTIDMAMEARKIGAKIIVITSVEYSKAVPSRHSGGKNLYEYGDIVIDNCGEIGDAAISVDNTGVKAGPTSTAAGAVIANMLAVGFAELCAANGIEPPIFKSANNVEDPDRDRRIFEKYRGQIHFIQ
ncbi:MAG: SIS domain-containing protein [Defluviitaleaceae bacterium]|nr:SIS domain-containing protein [Defluviitaleaceae bacterium]